MSFAGKMRAATRNGSEIIIDLISPFMEDEKEAFRDFLGYYLVSFADGEHVYGRWPGIEIRAVTGDGVLTLYRGRPKTLDSQYKIEKRDEIRKSSAYVYEGLDPETKDALKDIFEVHYHDDYIHLNTPIQGRVAEMLLDSMTAHLNGLNKIEKNGITEEDVTFISEMPLDGWRRYLGL